MSPSGAEGAVLSNLDLMTSYAEVLTLDTAVARALVRETLSREMFGRVEPGWLGSKMAALACMRRIFQAHYRTRECGRGCRADLLAGSDAGEFGHSLGALEVDERELLFLRFTADLSPDEIAELVGRDPDAVARTLEALCRRERRDLVFRRLGKPRSAGGERPAFVGSARTASSAIDADQGGERASVHSR